MPTVYEKIITGRNTHRYVSSESWYERFPAASNHNITHIALDINRFGAGAGNITVAIYSTIFDGALGVYVPNVSLASVTVDVDTIPDGFGASDEFPYDNRKECIGVVFALSGTVAVISGTYYAVVVTPSGSAALWWRSKGSTTYGGGQGHPGSWSSSGGDAMFECWDGSPSAATVTTQAASDVSPISVTLNGNRAGLGDSGQLHQYGFCWGTSANPTVQSADEYSETMLGVTTSTGDYSSVVTGLTVGVTYHYRAYVVGMGGIAYGDDVTFNIEYIAVPAVEIALNQSLMTVAPNWTPITADLKRYHILVGRMHDLDRVETGKAEILLDNRSGNYWRGNTASPYYGTTGNVKPVTLVRITEAYAGVAYDLFYGYIEAVFHSWVDKEGGMIPQTEFACVDMFKAFARMNVYPLAGTAGTHTYVAPLASNANSGQKLVVLTSIEGLFAGQSVTIADDTPGTEVNYIDTIAAATNTVTMLNKLANNYTVAQSGYVKKYPSVISSQRLKDMLLEKGFPAAMTAIDTGLVMVAAMIDAPTGTNVLEQIHDVVRAESGLAFMRGDGFFVFQNRDARQTGVYASSAATLKDDGDSHYVLPELADDDSLVYNTARVTPDNGDGETQEYFDSTMRDLHGERVWKDDSSLIASVVDAIEKALIVVERYKDSILRCSRVELIPAVNPSDLYPKIFGLGLSRRITLQLDSTANPALIDTQYHIEGIELTREVGAPYRAWWQLWDVKKLLVASIQYDGYLQKESLVSFADGHDAANADSAFNDLGIVAVGMQKDGAADWLFWRGFLKFDISGIAASKTALDAIVLVRINGYFIVDTEFDLTLVDGATLANPIIVNDYGDMIGAVTDFGSVTIPTPAIKAARWVGIRLTAAGLADLQAAITGGVGFQKFGVRSSLDISNTAPGGTTNQQYVIFDGKGSASPARLIVRVA